MKEFLAAPFVGILLEQRKQWGLRCMGSECGQLAFKVVLDIDCRTWRRLHNWLAADYYKVGGPIVKLLCAMGFDLAVELIGVAVGSRSPLECKGSENAGHPVIRVAGETPIRAESCENLRTESPDFERQGIDHPVEVLKIELSVRVVVDHGTSHLENLAGRRELSFAEFGKFLVAFRPRPMCTGLSRRQADHRRLNSGRMVFQ